MDGCIGGESKDDFARRILGYNAWAAAGGALILWWLVSWAVALSFLVGGLLAMLNFKWLTGAVDTALGAAHGSRKLALFRFFLRYALIVAALFAIFKVSRGHLLFAFLGLFTTAAAVLAESLRQLIKR